MLTALWNDKGHVEEGKGLLLLGTPIADDLQVRVGRMYVVVERLL